MLSDRDDDDNEEEEGGEEEGKGEHEEPGRSRAKKGQSKRAALRAQGLGKASWAVIGPGYTRCETVEL